MDAVIHTQPDNQNRDRSEGRIVLETEYSTHPEHPYYCHEQCNHIDNYLERDPGNRKRFRVFSGKKGKNAITEITVLAGGNNLSLVEADIMTGRTHQVRVHIASLNQANPLGVLEHRVILPNGEVRWQQWADRAIFDEQGHIVEFQAVGRDITAQKQAEAEREKRAVIVKAEGEVIAATNMAKAATTLGKSNGALHLRTLQSINDISSDQSNTVIFAVPLEVLKAFEGLSKKRK